MSTEDINKIRYKNKPLFQAVRLNVLRIGQDDDVSRNRNFF